MPFYYTNLNKIPFINWWDVHFKGKIESLNRFDLKFKFDFLWKIHQNMVYQMDNLDLSIVRKRAEYEILMAKYALTGNKMIEFEAGVLMAQINDELKKNETSKEPSMNDFIDYIELALNCPGTINPEKTSAGRVYSLYHRAKEKVERIKSEERKKKLHGKHN